MGQQRTFAGLAWSAKGKVTRRERFLAEMDAVIPWQRLMARIEPYYPKAGRGRRPLGLEKMLRIYFVQQWFDLSDPGAEDAIYDSESIRRFVGVELGEDRVPDETTILRFRRLLEDHELTEAIFAEIRDLLEEKRLLLKTGTIVDATIIHAPSSTKNATGQRDPEMKQGRKGKTWYFGMKVHTGTDKQGLTHTLTVTDAGAADIKKMPRAVARRGARALRRPGVLEGSGPRRLRGSGVRYRVNRRPTSQRPLSDRWKQINRSRSRVRARGEHGYHVVKRLWGFNKVRYRGLAKNRARALTAFALANLYLVRQKLMPPGAKCAL